MIYSDLIDEFPPEMREPVLRLIDHLRTDLSDSPTRADFQKLVSLVEIQGENIAALSIAQKRTEQRVEELAQAQARTEQRLEELAQAQKRTEERLEALTQRVEELAQAQKRTEERIAELAQTQIKSEKRLTGLEAVVNRLVEDVKTIRKEVGGLSHAVGYRLEDEAMWALPKLLPNDHSVEVQGNLRRGFLTLSGGKTVEVNVYGHGSFLGRTVTILGEAKTQLKKKDVDNFLKLVRLVSLSTDEAVFPIVITYQTSPPVEEYARDNGIAVYFSYQFRPY